MVSPRVDRHGGILSQGDWLGNRRNRARQGRYTGCRGQWFGGPYSKPMEDVMSISLEEGIIVPDEDDDSEVL